MLKISLSSVLALFVGACGPDPTIYVAADDLHLANARPGYQSVTSDVRAFQVIGPRDWIQLNQAVGPQGSATRGTAEGAGRGR